MLIRKIQQPAEYPDNNIYDAYNTSTTDTYSCHYINGLQTYSTTEQRIGTWIDGKPLYRKVISSTNAIAQGTTSIAHGISNPKLIMIESATLYNTSNGSCYPLNIRMYGSYSNIDEVCVMCSNTNVTFYSAGGWGTGWQKVIVLQYTKTTD